MTAQAAQVDVAAVFASMPQGRALILRGQAAAKQREASALLDEADQLEAAAAWDAECERLGLVQDTAEDAVPPLEDAAETARATLRTAEDRWRAAASAARKGHEAAEDAAQLSPEAEAEALKDRDARDEVLRRADATVHAARAALDQAEARAAAARKAARDAQQAYDAYAAAGPPRIVSSFTAAMDWQRLLAAKTPLGDGNAGIVRLLVTGYAETLGIDQDIRADERRKLKEQQEKRTASRPIEGVPASGGTTALAPSIWAR
jgi:hypothetical protein